MSSLLRAHVSFRPLAGACFGAAFWLAGCPESPPGETRIAEPLVEEAAVAPEPSVEAAVDAGPSPADLAAERAREAEARARAEVEARIRAESDARERADAEQRAFDAAYPQHGVAFHFLARVYDTPSMRGRVIGYMRRGARFRASERVPGRGCERGFHRVPGEGFVCRGEGVLIGSGPQTFEPSPAPAALEDALPYPYAYTPRRSAPQYFRIPSPAEEALVSDLFRRLDEAPTAAADAGVPDASLDPAETEATAPPGTSAAADVATSPDAGTPGGGLPDYVRMRMRRGFYVSVDGHDERDGRRFVRTVRGAYVPEEALTANTPPTHRGVILGGSWTLPVAFVYRGGAHRLGRDPSTGALRDLGPIAQHTPFAVRETITRQNATYLVSDEGVVVRDTALRVARLVPRPPRVEAGARWIHVDLSEQTLVAYDGDMPVFATTVSTGRDGFATPTGVFRIQSKHVSTTMDDLASGDEAYSIEDVPWTMYFQGNYALHGAFWHNQFGRVRSHGCVNLAPADARWLFQWSTPTLPASWHGVFATNRDAGTYIVVDP